MYQKIEAILKKIDLIFIGLTVISLGGMTLAIFLQVLFRYVFNSPLAWTEELSVFMFIWMTFLAGYVGARRGKHIGVSALKNALPELGSRILEFIANLISAVFFFIIVYSTTLFLPKLMTQTSPAMEIPMAFVYSIMIIGSFFMGLWYALLAVYSLSRKDRAEG
ncbi:MAG: TRAP transporter small permease [Spirochaetales bacterium]|nr:TRAP transporter small permease [Spirochaetales bacterium]